MTPALTPLWPGSVHHNKVRDTDTRGPMWTPASSLSRASPFFSFPLPPLLIFSAFLSLLSQLSGFLLSSPQPNMSAHDNEELIDYEDEHDVVTNGAPAAAVANGAASGTAPAADSEGDKDKKNFSGIHSTGFRCVGMSGVTTRC